MAESALPAGLEMLKIDLKRELDDFGTPNDAANPFSFVGSGARRKMRKLVPPEEQHTCPLGIFGNGFAKSPSRPTAASCQCNVYVPTKFRSHGKRSGQDGSLLQVKSTATFKRNIVQKSQLNFLKMHDVTKQSCQQIDPSTQSRSAKTVQRPSCMQSSEAISEVNSSKDSVQNQVPGTAVTDFKSLITSSQKQISSYTSNPVFDSLSFKSLQNSSRPKPHSRQYSVEHLDEKSDEDDLVNSVSKKLSVSGVAASNSNASCSQEARLTANAYCDEHDISIDELASYFEDFVHIPKKMSLMAEQMYI